ncbi:Ig-like domain-containing protein [bacterium]|nr:Ig-like domain-containing protein [bacterium]
MINHKRINFLIVVLLSVALLASVWIACQKTGNMSPYSPELQSVVDSMWASPLEINVGSSSDIYARVVNENTGNTQSNVEVNFTCDSGYVSPSNSRTNANGIARVRYTYAGYDSARFNANIVGGVYGREDATTIVKVYPADYPITTVEIESIYADPSQINAGEQSKIYVKIVEEATGDPVEGITINFSVSSFPPFGGLSPEYVNTDSNGWCHTTYSTDISDTARFVDIKAEVAGLFKTVRILVYETDYLPVEIDTIYAVPSEIVAGDNCEVYVVIVDEDTREPYPNARVSFSRDFGTLSPSSDLSDADGIAHTTLSTPNSTVEVIAHVTALISGLQRSVSILVHETGFIPAGYLTLRVVNDSMEALPAGDSILVEARLENIHHSPLQGETINFSSPDITIITVNSGITNSMGKAWAYFPNSGDTVTALAIARYDTLADTVTVHFVEPAPPPVTDIVITTDSTRMTANGVSYTQVRAIVYTGEGLARDSTLINFYASAGRLLRITTSRAKGTNAPGIEALRSPFRKNDQPSKPQYSFTATLDDFISEYTVGGVAQVYLRSTTTVDTSILTASKDGVVDSTRVLFVPGPPDNIELLPAEMQMTADGRDTMTVKAFLTDAYGNSVISGYNVEFEILEGLGCSFIPSAFINTDITGMAKVLLRSGNISGYATLRASYGVIYDQVVIFIASSVPYTIYLQSSPPFLTADGVSYSNLQAQVLDESSLPVTDGVPIMFYSTEGVLMSASRGLARPRSEREKIPFDPSYQTLAALDSSAFIAYTTGGIATLRLMSSTESCTAMVVSYAETSRVMVAADTIYVPFQPGSPDDITLFASKDTLTANEDDTCIVTALVVDGFDNPVEDDYLVNFTVTSGRIVSSAYTDENGRARVILTSSLDVGSQTIEATCAGAMAHRNLYYQYNLPSEINLSLSALRIVANGTSRDTITAEIFDSDRNHISNGTDVQFRSMLGSLEMARSFARRSKSRTIMEPLLDNIIVESEGGYAQAVLISPTTAGIDTVIVTVSVDTVSVVDTILVEYIPGAPGRLVVSADPDTIFADNTATSTITIQVFDEFDNRVGRDIAVNVNTTLGTVYPGVAYTTTGGVATATLRSGYEPGVATVEASIGGIRQQTQVFFIESAPAIIILTTDQNYVQIGNTLGLNALALDATGHIVSDGMPINFSSVLGFTEPPIAFTFSGVATSILHPQTDAGWDTVIAYSGDVADTALVQIKAGLCQYIELSANPDTIAADGRSRSTITARCRDEYGNIVGVGRMVSFSTSLGTITSTVSTDSLGIAQALLTSAPDIGTAQVRAICESGSQIVEVEFVATEAAFISVSANPSKIVADEDSFSTIRALVLNDRAEPVADGTIVIFHSYHATTGLPFGSIDSLTSTTGGIATSLLYAENITGDAVVVASVMGLSDSVIVEFIPGPAARIDIEAVPDTIPADGVTLAEISATLFDIHNNRLPEGKAVNFQTTLGAVNRSFSRTDSTGTARVNLRSSTVSGEAIVTASSGGVENDVVVFFSPLEVVTLFLTADSLSLVADGRASTVIRALALDSWSNPVSDNTPIIFSTSLGNIVPGVAYTEDGYAFTTLISGDSPGTAMVIGNAGGGVMDTVYVNFVTGPPATIDLIAVPNVLPADGDTTALVYAAVMDASGNPVRPGFIINFSTTLGSIDTFAITDTLGEAAVTFYAGITPGNALVIATAGEAVGQTQITLTNTEAGEIIMTIDPGEIVADAHSTGTITGQVLNTVGFPVTDGTPVIFSVVPDSLGRVSPRTAYTLGGQFTATFTSRTYTGSAYIFANVGSALDSVLVDLIPGPADYIILEADTYEIPADSSSFASITGTVYDRYGNTVRSGVPVSFSTNLGELVPASEETDSRGQISFILRSGYEPGVARVRAQYGSARGEIEIVITSTTARSITLTATPNQITADGFSTSTLEALVLDSLGNFVSDGTPVRFSSLPGTAFVRIDSLTFDTTYILDTLGAVIPTISYTELGVATAIFRAGTIPGNARVQASIDSIYDRATIRLKPGPVAAIIVTAEPETIAANGLETSVITAWLYDEFDNPVSSGIGVTFVTSMGNINPTSTLTNSLGRAYTILTSTDEPGIAFVTVSSGGFSEIVEVVFKAPIVNDIILTAYPNRIQIGEDEVIQLSALVVDFAGRPIYDGVLVNFSSAIGNLTPPTATTSGGVAQTDLLAGIRAGTDTVIATADGISDTITVRFLAGLTSYLILTPEDSIIAANGRARTNIIAELRDEYNNLVGVGRSVAFSTDLGTITTPAYTDSMGIAIAVLTSAEEIGVASIEASCELAIGRTTVEFVDIDVAYLLVRATPRDIVGNGIATSTISAKALNSLGNPVADGTVIYFESFDSTGASFGEIEVMGITSGGTGTATVELVSAESLGRCFVRAYLMGFADTTYVDFIAGPVATIDVYADPASIFANGYRTSQITAFLYDDYGNPIPDGQEVTFETDLGSIYPGLSYTVAGSVQATLVSADSAGIAHVLVRSGDVVGFTSVVFVFVPVGNLFIYSDSVSLVANGFSTTQIYALVTDDSGRAITNGTPIYFDSNIGLVIPGVSYTNDGQAISVLRSTTHSGDTCWVRVDAGVLLDSIDIPFVAGPPAKVNLTAIPTSIPANGDTFSEIEAFITDINDNPIGGGYIVRFSSSLGSIDTMGITDDSSRAYVILRAGITPGTALVLASIEGALGQVRVNFTDSTTVEQLLLFADPREIVADGRSTSLISGFVYNDLGNPIADGSPIELWVSQDSMATISPRTVYTDSGAFSATLMAGIHAGNVAVIALAAPVQETTYVGLQPGEPDSIEVWATDNDTIIPADSFTAVQINARIYDRYGNPLRSGVDVNFETLIGIMDPISTRTNSNGIAYSYLMSGFQPGRTTVRVTSGDGVGEIDILFTNTEVFTVSLTADPMILAADGFSTSSITAYVMDSLGNAVSNRTPVFFTDTPDSLGNLIPNIGFTEGGEVNIIYRVGTDRGDVVVRAYTFGSSVLDTIDDNITLSIDPGSVNEILLSATDSTIDANGYATTEIIAVLLDEYGNGVLSGIPVNFSTSMGSIDPNIVYTNNNGEATSILTSGNVPGRARVTVNSGSIYSQIEITFDTTDVGNITITANPRTLTADGVSNAVITVNVYDSYGAPVSDRTRVDLRVNPPDRGTVISPKMTTDGTAISEYNAGIITGEIWVVAQVETLLDSVRIQQNPGNPNSITLIPDSASIPADGMASTWIHATILDEFGNPVRPGTRVLFETDRGSITSSAMTDTSGNAQALLQAGIVPGRAIVIGTCGDAVGFTQVLFDTTVVQNIILTADTNYLVTDGVSSINLTAYVMTLRGTPVSDGTEVSFFVEGGYGDLMPNIAYTDSGYAEVKLRSDTSAVGGREVYAVAGSDTATITVYFVPGPPLEIKVVILAFRDTVIIDELPADGASNATVQCTVWDRFGNIVTPGTPVTFQTELGSITPIDVTDITGSAQALLTSGTETGLSLITLRSQNAVAYTQIEYTELVAHEIILTINPPTLPADGISSAQVIATVFDSLGIPVSDGTPINFIQDTSSTFVTGRIIPGRVRTEAGQALTEIYSPIVTGTARVIASASGTVADTFDMRFIPGDPAIIVHDTTLGTIFYADGGSYDIRVFVYDAYSNPVQLGTEVHFSATRGDFIDEDVIVYTDSGGAMASIASSEAGISVITVTSGMASTVFSIDFMPIQAYVLYSVATPFSLPADGISMSTITATVLDSNYRPVSDGLPVFFNIFGPGILSPRTVLTENGLVQSYLTSTTIAGSTLVVVSISDSLADTLTITFMPGEAANLEFVTPIRDLYATGIDTQTVWVHVRDEYGNDVRPGTRVDFSIYPEDLATVLRYNATNDSGHARTLMTSGTREGSGILSAESGEAIGYALVRFLTFPAGSIIVITDSVRLVANGRSSTDITATVFDDTLGLPISDGAIVRFSATRGAINPVIDYTEGGVARSTLTSNISPFDTVWVFANIGAVEGSTSVSFIPGPPHFIEIWARDSSILANGVDTTTITVRVLDEFGNRVGPGERINFSATLGTVSPSYVYTDTSSEASIVLISSRDAGWSAVNAISTDGDGNAAIIIQFMSTEVGHVDLSVSPTRLTADGSSSAIVRVTVLDIEDAPVANGTPVQFSGLNLGIVDPVYTTTMDGVATATLYAFTEVGKDSIIACSGGICDTQRVVFESGDPAVIWLRAARSQIIANLVDRDTIYVVVEDDFNNRVGPGHIVNFDLLPDDIGDITPTAVTDTAGSCFVMLQAGRKPGLATVLASSGSATGVVQVELLATMVGSVSLNVPDRYLPADGVSSTNLIALVLDTLGNPITDGTGVYFMAYGNPAILYPTWASTDTGFADVIMMSSHVGTTFVYARVDTGGGSGIFSDTVEVYFHAGDPVSITFDTAGIRISSVTLMGNGVDSIGVTATVKDAFSNPAPGVYVTFSLSLGLVAPMEGITDSAGQIDFNISAPRQVGVTQMKAQCGSAVAYLRVRFQAPPIMDISLTASPSGLPANGIATSQIRAFVRDSSGYPISDGLMVFFTAQLGAITPFGYTSSGYADAILISADSAGIDTISAICMGESALVVVRYEAGSPSRIELYTSADTVTVGASEIVAFSGQVLDEGDNPVVEGTIVSLSINDPDFGSLADWVVTTDDSGWFSTEFTPGLKAGLAWLKASSSGIRDSINIILFARSPNTMEIEVSDTFIYVIESGEVDQSVLMVRVYDIYNNYVADSTKVWFELVNYPGTTPTQRPSFQPSNPLNPLESDTVYILNGRASATLRAGTHSGTVRIDAHTSSISTRAPRIVISSGLPYTISLSRAECNVRGWDIDGVPNQITAIVSDTFANPVAPGTAVWFTTTEGVVVGNATTDDSGFAFTTWYSSEPRDSGWACVIGESRGAGGHVAIDTTCFFNSGPIYNLSVVVTPSNVLADGISEAEVYVEVQDINGNPVIDDFSITLEAEKGDVTNVITTVNECFGSYAVGTYTSTTVEVDSGCSLPLVYRDVIRARAGIVTGSATVNLLNGPASETNSSISAPTRVPYGATVPVSTNIEDIFGNPICGENLTYSSSYGTILPLNSITDNIGRSFVSYTAPAVPADSAEHISVISVSFTGGVLFTEITLVMGKVLPEGALDFVPNEGQREPSNIPLLPLKEEKYLDPLLKE